MAINLDNFFKSIGENSKMSDFQDLNHIDGVSVSTTCADLYSKKRDDVVLFYFRDGANHASVYTQSKLISENIKWNLKNFSHRNNLINCFFFIIKQINFFDWNESNYIIIIL